MRAVAFVGAALSIVACAALNRVTITGSGRDLGLVPRQGDCAIEFFRTKPPDRSYDEVATIHYEAAPMGAPDAAGAQEALRRAACGLGADAVVVTRDFAMGLMTGTAVSFPERRRVHRREADRVAAERRREAALRAERAARDSKAAEANAARARSDGIPPGWLRAKVRSETVVRSWPERSVQGSEVLAAGTSVWVSPTESNRHRRVRRAGADIGWIESSDLELEVGSVPAATAAPPPADEPPVTPRDTDI